MLQHEITLLGMWADKNKANVRRMPENILQSLARTRLWQLSDKALGFKLLQFDFLVTSIRQP